MSSRSKWDVLVGSDLQKHENKVVNLSSMDPPPTVSAGLRQERHTGFTTHGLLRVNFSCWEMRAGILAVLGVIAECVSRSTADMMSKCKAEERK